MHCKIFIVVLVGLVALATSIEVTSPLDHLSRYRRALSNVITSTNTRVKRDTTDDSTQTDDDQMGDDFGKALLSAFGGTGGDGSSGSGNPFCFLGCMSLLEKLGSSSGETTTTDSSTHRSDRSMKHAHKKADGTSAALSFFHSDKNDSMSDDLPTMCANFNEAKKCLDKCGDSPFTSIIQGTFQPLVFMCQTNYDEFVKYSPCFDKAGESPECDAKCGDESVLDNITMSADVDDTDNLNITDMTAQLGSICGYLGCHVSCMRPSLIAACNNDKRAGDLFEEFIGYTVGGMTSIFDKIGMGALNPPECKKLSDKAPPLPAKPQRGVSDNDVPSFAHDGKGGHRKEIDELTIKKLNLEMEVLNKESAKLDLEMQVLQMQLKAGNSSH